MEVILFLKLVLFTDHVMFTGMGMILLKTKYICFRHKIFLSTNNYKSSIPQILRSRTKSRRLEAFFRSNVKLKQNYYYLYNSTAALVHVNLVDTISLLFADWQLFSDTVQIFQIHITIKDCLTLPCCRDNLSPEEG